MPERRLTKVVLPAPLGPISAWRAPAGRLKVTLLVARQAANALDQAISRRTALISRLLNGDACTFDRRPMNAAAHEQHQHHQHEAEPELPVLRRGGGEAGRT